MMNYYNFNIVVVAYKVMTVIKNYLPWLPAKPCLVALTELKFIDLTLSKLSYLDSIEHDFQNTFKEHGNTYHGSKCLSNSDCSGISYSKPGEGEMYSSCCILRLKS